MNPIIILLIAALVTGGMVALPRKAYASQYDEFFKKYASNPRLAKAIGVVESDLRADAMGDQGKAFGIMQIWYSTAQGHGYRGGSYGLLDPATNIYYATRELNHLVDAYGFEKGIMGYNVGETKLRKGVSNPAYLDKVLYHYGRVTV